MGTNLHANFHKTISWSFENCFHIKLNYFSFKNKKGLHIDITLVLTEGEVWTQSFLLLNNRLSLKWFFPSNICRCDCGRLLTANNMIQIQNYYDLHFHHFWDKFSNTALSLLKSGQGVGGRNNMVFNNYD